MRYYLVIKVADKKELPTTDTNKKSGEGCYKLGDLRGFTHNEQRTSPDWVPVLRIPNNTITDIPSAREFSAS